MTQIPPKMWKNSPQKPLLATQKCFLAIDTTLRTKRVFLKCPQQPDFEILDSVYVHTNVVEPGQWPVAMWKTVVGNLQQLIFYIEK